MPSVPTGSGAGAAEAAPAWSDERRVPPAGRWCLQGLPGVGAHAYMTNCLGGNYKNNENMRDYLMTFDNVCYCLILLECSGGADLKAALTARAGMLVVSP